MSRWHEQRAKSWQDRFWENVQKAEGEACWLWTGARDRRGYGYLSVEGRFAGAHRASWMIHQGPIPPGMGVLHRCDTPPCVNPAHLFIGTHLDNMADRDQKGRTRKGETQPRARLTGEAVADIRRRHAAGEEIASIAADHGIAQTTVTNVANGARWAHLGGAVEGKRMVKGERHHAARLNADLVREIRRRAAAGENLSAMARELGVSNGAIDHCVARRSWKHVKDEGVV
jgi:hypothetical protein